MKLIQKISWTIMSLVFALTARSQVELTAGSLTGLTTGQTVVVPVTVKRFGTVTSVQFTMQWDPAVLEFLAVQDFGLNGLTSGSFGTTLKAAGKVTASWDDPDSLGVSVSDGTKIFGASFKVLGANGTSTQLKFVDDPAEREVTVNFDAAQFAFTAGLISVGTSVTPVNTLPVAVAQSVTTDEDVAMAIVLAGTDADGNSLTATVVSQPTKGVLSGTAPNLVYTPTANANGADLFTFKVNDGTSDSSTATVAISIIPVNDVPVAVAQSVTTDEDVAKPVVIVATDVDGDTLSYIVVTPPTKGVLSGTAPNLVYTPTANANGADLFTF